MMHNDIRVSGSLRKRLGITLIGGVALLTILLFFAIRNYAVQIAQQSQDSILQASVTSILDATTFRDGVVETDIPYSAFSMLNTSTDDRIFYAILEGDQLLTGYDELQVPTLNNRSANLVQTTTFRGVPVRQVTASRVLIGATDITQVTASIAQTQDSLADELSRISRNAAIFGLGFFCLAVMLSIWATSSTINPLQRLADSVGRRGPQDLSPVIKPVPQEMVPLVSSLNSLMARLDQSFKQSEDFIAEAAHRLRTPITTVRSQAETTLQRVDKEENRRALRSMIRAIDETSRAAGQLLDHAMITFRANQLEFQAVNLVELVEEILISLSPIGDMKDVAFQLDCDRTVSVSGDPILLQNAVRNLLDNALKYSPIESTIAVEVRALPSPHLVIRDQGPGFQLEEVDSLTERFRRGHNAIDTIGSGLGLTIAQDVATAHGGQLLLNNNATGGACVTLSF